MLHNRSSPNVDDDLAKGTTIQMVECRRQVGERIARIDYRGDPGLVDGTDQSFQSLSAAGAYPNVRVDLVIDNDLTDVVAQGFDAGVRIGGQISRDMIAVRITPDLRMAVVGSPSYFADRHLPEAPADIQEHACLTYKWKNTGALYQWRFAGGDSPVIAGVETVLTINDTDLLLSAAREGVGLAYIIEDLAAPFIENGDLVRVLEPWCKPFPGFYLYYSERKHMPAAVRAFVDFMKVTTL